MIVGADRIAANGDTANKIGTYGVAVLARHPRHPVLRRRPVEHLRPVARRRRSRSRSSSATRREVTHGFGTQTAPEGVDVYNPAFDVTPAELITAIITEQGVLRPPYHLSRYVTSMNESENGDERRSEYRCAGIGATLVPSAG